ncbi:MAG TPA: DinB family protein, partial [Vicinamibacteria bacterium]|nr:DinB family protein [Vicinamibacteria bacterium]
DSHMNAYVRFRLALTEDEPTIRPYREERWAELPDSKSAPLEMSLSLLEALHRRFTLVLRNIRPEEWTRRYRHPDIGLMTLETALADYAWHGRHHVGQITSLRERSGWV